MSQKVTEKPQILGIRKPATRRSKKKQHRVTIRDPSSSDSSDRTSEVVEVLEKRRSTPDIDILDWEDADLEESANLEAVEESFEDEPEKDYTLQQVFFEQFDDMPDIDNLELSEEEEGQDMTVVAVEPQPEDEGQYIDPLTGEIVEEEPPEVLEEASVEEATVEEEIEEVTEDEEIDVLLTLPEVKEDLELRQTLTDDETLQVFMEMHMFKDDEHDEFDAEAMKREIAARELYDQTVEFLDELITITVDRYEDDAAQTMLFENLNKRKLMEKLVALSKEYEKAQIENKYLNRRVIDHCRRKKFVRPLVKETQHTIDRDQPKYEEKLKQLDHIMGEEVDVKLKYIEKTSELDMEASNLEKTIASNNMRFEHRVTESLTRGKSDRFKNFIAYNLKRMSKLREQVSEIREKLIQRQHTLAAIMEKLEITMDIGNGISVQQYETVQSEVTMLTKMLEERGNELGKLHIDHNCNLHHLSHLEEKRDMILTKIKIQEETLKELIEEQKCCRQYLYEVKLKREKIRKDINTYTLRSGILNKPALMYDYDETLEKLASTLVSVEEARKQYADLIADISSMEDPHGETKQDADIIADISSKEGRRSETEMEMQK